MAEDEVPRAKRLKLLREAKLRKEREEKGEVPAPLGDDGPAASPQSPQESKELGEQGDDEPSPVEDSAIVEKPASDAEDEDEAMELAPKRANWDIERDIAPMLKKLEKRTQHTIVEILREKIAAEQQEEEEDEEEEASDDDEAEDEAEQD